MKISGLIRQTGRKPGRFVAGRQSPPQRARPDGTAHRRPDAHHSGPGLLSSVRSLEMSCTVPKPVPRQPAFTSYLVPLERKSRLGPAKRSNFH